MKGVIAVRRKLVADKTVAKVVHVMCMKDGLQNLVKPICKTLSNLCMRKWVNISSAIANDSSITIEMTVGKEISAALAPVLVEKADLSKPVSALIDRKTVQNS